MAGGAGAGGADGADQNPQEVLKDCLTKFGSPDFIMEPEIFSQLKKYFQVRPFFRKQPS